MAGEASGGACPPGLGGVCNVATDIVAGAVGSATDSVISGLAQDFAEASTQLMETLTGFWLDLPTPVVDSPTGVAAWLQDRTWLFVAAAAVAGVLVAAMKTALSGDKRPLAEMVRGLGWVMLVTAGGAFVVSQLVYIADGWASWVYEGSVGDEPINLGIGLTSAASPGLVLIMALAAACTGLVQIGLMLARAALIPILVGLLPIAAAASMTGTGRQWFGKIVAWLAAFILYKPVAALLYAAAFELSDGRDGILGMVSGVALLILAVLALPALMRVIVPATAALGSANPASIAAGVAGGVAAGAVTVVAAGAAVGTGGASAGGAAATKSAGTAGAGRAASTAGTSSAGGGPSGSGPAPSGGSGPKPSGGAPAPPSGAGSAPETASTVAGGGSTGATGSSGADGTSGSSGTDGSSGSTGTSTSAGGSTPTPPATQPRTGAPVTAAADSGAGGGGGAVNGSPSTAAPGAGSSGGDGSSTPSTNGRRPPIPRRPSAQGIPEATGSWVTDENEES